MGPAGGRIDAHHVGPRSLIKDEPGYLLDRQMAMAGHNVTVGVERHQVRALSSPRPRPLPTDITTKTVVMGFRMSKEACGPDMLVVAYG